MRTNLIKTTLVVDEKPAKEKKATSAEGIHDMIIAFDTTGSMYSYLNAVKTHVTSLIPELLATNPNMRIGVVAFGDYCDMPGKNKFGNAYQSKELTRDAKSLIKFVKNAARTSGGDNDEFYELVIHKIINETDWREDAIKTVLLIADASPHRIGYTYKNYVVDNQIDWREEAKDAASKCIQFDTLSITGSSWYKELSDMTNGVYAPFISSSKTQEAVKMSAFSRGGMATIDAFTSTMCSYEKAGDRELTAMANAYSKKLSTDINSR